MTMLLDTNRYRDYGEGSTEVLDRLRTREMGGMFLHSC
jgi:hypothetical protein